MAGGLVLAAGSALDASPVELIEAAAAVGFAGVGLRLTHGRMPEIRELAELRTRADDLGMAIHDVEVHRVGEGHDVEPLVEAAEVLGAQWLLVVSDVHDEAATTDEIGRVAMAARSAGVRVGVEYMAWTTPSDPVSAVRIAVAADCHVVVDVLHHYRVGAGLAQIRSVVDSGRLGWLQLCDAPRVAPDDLLKEARHGRLAPGAGMLPLHDVVAELPAGVSISVEVQSDELTGAMTVRERSAHLASSARPYVRHR